MSDFAEKLATPERSGGVKARASRKQLLARWGSAEASSDRINIDTIGGREVWRRVTGEIFEQETRT